MDVQGLRVACAVRDPRGKAMPCPYNIVGALGTARSTYPPRGRLGCATGPFRV